MLNKSILAFKSQCIVYPNMLQRILNLKPCDMEWQMFQTRTYYLNDYRNSIYFNHGDQYSFPNDIHKCDNVKHH